jgi:hypothetical protein
MDKDKYGNESREGARDDDHGKAHLVSRKTNHFSRIMVYSLALTLGMREPVLRPQRSLMIINYRNSIQFLTPIHFCDGLPAR